MEITMLIVSKVAEPRRAGRKEDDGLDDEEEVCAVGSNIIIIIIFVIIISLHLYHWIHQQSLDAKMSRKTHKFVLIATPQIPTRASLVKASAAFLNAKGGVARAKHGKHSWRRK